MALVKRSFSLAGHRTSVALEPEFWVALAALADTRGQALSALVARVDAGRGPAQPLASALRVAALRAHSEKMVTAQVGQPRACQEVPGEAG